MSLFKGASRTVFRATTAQRAAASICGARRAASSSRMTMESQQKVCYLSIEFANSKELN